MSEEVRCDHEVRSTVEICRLIFTRITENKNKKKVGLYLRIKGHEITGTLREKCMIKGHEYDRFMASRRHYSCSKI